MRLRSPVGGAYSAPPNSVARGGPHPLVASPTPLSGYKLTPMSITPMLFPCTGMYSNQGLARVYSNWQLFSSLLQRLL